MSTPAGNLVGDATINVNANTAGARGELDRFARHADGRLRDVRGRFISESRLIGTAFNRAAGGGSAFSGVLEKLKGAAIGLAPALIPIAAQAAPIAAGLGAATVAVGAFAAAAGGQVAAITEASEAEKKYQDAIDEHGRASKEATDAQAAYVRSVQKMPPATREATAALSSFKDQYKEWSDSLAGDTMPVVTKSLQAFGAVFPKLTPMVQGAGVQLNRFVTIAAGGIASPGFDRFMRSFSEFATGALERGNDALIRFMRTLDTGKISGGFSTFMDYVRDNGPIVRETLSNVMQALGNMAQAAANMGPGLLTVVNALAGLVAAVPPGVITAMLQLALAMKAVRLAAIAMAATSGGIAAFTASIAAMRLAAGGAVGILPRLGAAIATLSRTAKVAIAGTGIGLLLIALSELSQIGQTAPLDVDRLTSSLAKLGHTGKAAGYAAEQFGANFGKLRSEIDRVTNPSVAESINNWGASITGGFLDAGDDTEKFTKSIDAIDSSLADLVSGGKAAQAAAAIQVMTKGMNSQQLEKFNSGLGDYREKLADLKLEQQITAQAMGLFGAQAQQTSAKLAEQKASADGLRQAIQALNDVNRGALGAQNAFEASIDALAEAAKKGAGALRYVKGEVDLNTEAARNADNALRATAQSTEEYAAAARESGAGWAKVNGIYAQGRTELLAQAQQFFRTKEEAQKYVDTILSVPQNKTAMLKADITDWKTKISEAEKQLKNAKGDKKARLTADIADWKAKVAAADLQLKGTKADKRAKLTADVTDWRAKVAAAELQLRTAKGEKKATLKANIDDWRRKIGTAQLMINNLPASKTTTLTVNRVTRFTTINETSSVPIARRPDLASGGLVRGYAAGGNVQAFPHGGFVKGPGSSTSDSILALLASGASARVSDTEYVMRGAAVRKYGVPFMDAVNAMRLAAPGGRTGATASVSSSVGTARTMGAAPVTVENHYSFTLENKGMIGSQRDMETWLVKALENLRRTKRLPSANPGS